MEVACGLQRRVHRPAADTFGVSDNTGNTAWLKFPFLPFSIGPAEVVKITFTLLLAKQLEWLREVKRDLKSFPPP